MQDAKAKDIDNILILSGDHLYRMDYMDFVQVYSSHQYLINLVIISSVEICLMYV